MKIEGTEHLEDLPKHNVLFVSNHQTYFADVITFVHIFCAVKWKKFNRLGIPYYLLNPFTNVYFIAAEETMNDNWISKLFKLGGALTVKRTWRAEGKDVERQRDVVDTQKIDKALAKSWVITFPQGTTKPFAPGRKGTAHIIKNNHPVQWDAFKYWRSARHWCRCRSRLFTQFGILYDLANKYIG